MLIFCCNQYEQHSWEFSLNTVWEFEISTKNATSQPFHPPRVQLDNNKPLQDHKRSLESSCWSDMKRKQEETFHKIVSTLKESPLVAFHQYPHQSSISDQIKTMVSKLTSSVSKKRALLKKMNKDVHAWDETDEHHVKSWVGMKKRDLNYCWWVKTSSKMWGQVVATIGNEQTLH